MITAQELRQREIDTGNKQNPLDSDIRYDEYGLRYTCDTIEHVMSQLEQNKHFKYITVPGRLQENVVTELKNLGYRVFYERNLWKDYVPTRNRTLECVKFWVNFTVVCWNVLPNLINSDTYHIEEL